MNVTNLTTPHACHVHQDSLRAETELAISDPIACDESARGFLKSGDIQHFIETAKVVAAKLKGPDRHLNDVTLPYQLTPLHIACLAGDNDLMRSALNDARCSDWLDQCTEVVPVEQLHISVGDQQMPVMNGDPALHLALFTEWDEGALQLIGALKSQDKLAHTVNNTGNSVLNLAASKSSLKVVEALCDHLRDFEDYRSYLLHKTDNDSSILHHAVQQKEPDVYTYLYNQQFLHAERFRINIIDPDSLTNYHQDKGGKTPYDMIVDKVINIIVDKMGKRYDAQQLKTDHDLHDHLFIMEYYHEPWLKYCMENIFCYRRSLPVSLTRTLDWLGRCIII